MAYYVERDGFVYGVDVTSYIYGVWELYGVICGLDYAVLDV